MIRRRTPFSTAALALAACHGPRTPAATPEETAAFIAAETARWTDVARAAGIHPE